MADEFKSWAIVEVMGHQEYAGFVLAETIAGAPMIRVDVPEVSGREAFTKYLSPAAIYGISPCTEQTARLRAAAIKKTPFESWSVERQVIERLRDEGKLIAERQLEHASVNGEEDEPDFDDSDSDE